MDFKSQLITLLAAATSLSPEEITPLVTIPPNRQFGDYAFPCFKLGNNSREEAEKLQQKLQLPLFIAKTQVVGPYLNFFLDQSVLAAEIQIRERQVWCWKKQEKNSYRILRAQYQQAAALRHLRNMSLGNA